MERSLQIITEMNSMEERKENKNQNYVKIWLSREIKEPLFSLFLCTTGDLITGFTMGFFSSSISAFPAIMVLIPASIGMRGNIFASLGSRLGTYLHTGQIRPDFRENNLLNQNIFSSIALSFLISFYIGALASLTAYLLGLRTGTVDLILISMLAGVLSAVIMILFTILIAFLSFRRGWDPDNLTAPLITLMGDMLTLPLIFISMHAIANISLLGKMILLLILLFPIPLSVIYSKGKEVYSKILRESIPILLACGLIEMFSGSILGKNIETLLLAPTIMVMLPSFLEDGGAMGGILASRLSSSLHLGIMKIGRKIPRLAWKRFATMHMLGIIVFSFIGALAHFIAHFLRLPSIPLHASILVALLGGEILLVIVDFMVYYISIESFKRGIDPDNVTIPIVTSTVDFIGAGCLLFSFLVLQATLI